MNRLPNSQHAKAKRALQEIWMAETKTDADAALPPCRIGCGDAKDDHAPLRPAQTLATSGQSLT